MERRMDLHRTPMNLAILLRLFIKTGSLLIQCAIKNHNLVIMAILPLVPPFSHTPQYHPEHHPFGRPRQLYHPIGLAADHLFGPSQHHKEEG